MNEHTILKIKSNEQTSFKATITHLFADNKGLLAWMKAIQPLIKAT